MNILHSFFSIATAKFASPKPYYLVEPTRSWNSHSEAMELWLWFLTFTVSHSFMCLSATKRKTMAEYKLEKLLYLWLFCSFWGPLLHSVLLHLTSLFLVLLSTCYTMPTLTAFTLYVTGWDCLWGGMWVPYFMSLSDLTWYYTFPNHPISGKFPFFIYNWITFYFVQITHFRYLFISWLTPRSGPFLYYCK